MFWPAVHIGRLLHFAYSVRDTVTVIDKEWIISLTAAILK